MKCKGGLTLFRKETNEYGPVILTADGNISLPDQGYDENLIDVEESWIGCETHGRLSVDQYEDHGVSEDWQEV